jgi:hypothetical protein
MRFGSEMPQLPSRTETNQNDAERPRITTEITTLTLQENRGVSNPDLAEIVDAWKDLPESIRRAIAALVRAARPIS